MWIAHGIHFNDAEVARLGETSTGIAHCPSSNSRLGSGIARVVDLTAAGAPVGLGVDGVASNEIGTLFPEMRMALFLARQRDLSATTFAPARRTGIGHRGRRPVSRPRRRRPARAPGCAPTWWCGQVTILADVLDPIAGLVLGPERTARHVFVDGEPPSLVTDT